MKFISFDDIRENPETLEEFDVLLNVGDADTAYTGGENWTDECIVTAVKDLFIRRRIYRRRGAGGAPVSGAFPPACHSHGSRERNRFTLNVDKYNWEEHDHFIKADCTKEIDFGEGKKNMYALDGTQILVQRDKEVQMAVREFGKGRSVYISGLPYSFENSRILYRSILWSAHDEENLHKWFSTNFNVEVHAYVKNGKYCVVTTPMNPRVRPYIEETEQDLTLT